MTRNRFVDSDVVRLELSDGDWIEIKKELGVGERKRLEGSPLATARKDKTDENEVEMGISWDRYFLMKLELYIMDWSLRDKAGKAVRVSKAAIGNLRDEDAEEMMSAITAHEEALTEEAKNRTGVIEVVRN